MVNIEEIKIEVNAFGTPCIVNNLFLFLSSAYKCKRINKTQGRKFKIKNIFFT